MALVLCRAPSGPAFASRRISLYLSVSIRTPVLRVTPAAWRVRASILRLLARAVSALLNRGFPTAIRASAATKAFAAWMFAKASPTCSGSE